MESSTAGMRPSQDSDQHPPPVAMESSTAGMRPSQDSNQHPPPAAMESSTDGMRYRHGAPLVVEAQENESTFQPSVDGVTGSAIILTIAPDLTKDVLLYGLINKCFPTPMKKSIGAFFVVFLALQVLAQLYITVCEDGGIYRIILEGQMSYSELSRRYILFSIRVGARFVTPLIFLIQINIMAKNSHKFYAGQNQCYKELVTSLHHHIFTSVKYKELLGSIGSKEMPFFHAISFAGLLYYLGAYQTAEDRVMGEGLCDLRHLFQINFNFVGIRFNLIMFCDCIVVFCILLLMGVLKDCYCLENKIAKGLDKPYYDAIRRRWVVIDWYSCVMSICLTTFAIFSFAYGKPFLPPDSATNLHAHNVVTWFFWMVFLTVLQLLGQSSNRYMKWGCLVSHAIGYGCIIFFVFFIKVENVSIPPGSFVLLYYTSLVVSVFNLLLCLLCNKRGKRAYCSVAWCCGIGCLVLLLLTFIVTVVRECVHFALIVLA